MPEMNLPLYQLWAHMENVHDLVLTIDALECIAQKVLSDEKYVNNFMETHKPKASIKIVGEN